jgi:ribosome biogenesis protein ENP2
MGPAPKWCSFLENLTEELEANPNTTVYDDYKFVTKQELEQLGLDNLIGTNLLRAYMHGYFIDIRLYRKAKLVNEPFNFDEFKRNKIKEKLEKERENRVKVIRKLPVVNTELAKRIIEEKEDPSVLYQKKKKAPISTTNLLEDKRFAELFNDPNFQIDPNSEEFKLLNPVVQKVNEKKLKKKTQVIQIEDDSKYKKQQNRLGQDEPKYGSTSESEDDDEYDLSESSSDDEHEWKKTVKDNYKQLQKDKREGNRFNNNTTNKNTNQNLSLSVKQPKFYEIKDGLEYYSTQVSSGKESSRLNNEIIKKELMKKLPLMNRLKIEENDDRNASRGDQVIVHNDSYGNKQMTFMSRKARRDKDAEKQAREHHEERKHLRRSAGKIVKTLKKPMGKGFFKK